MSSRGNSRKTECGAKQFPTRLVARAAPFALLGNSPAQRSAFNQSNSAGAFASSWLLGGPSRPCADLIRWMAESKKLSKNQFRALEPAVHLRQPVAISAITLIEIALLFTGGSLRIKTAAPAGLFDELSANPTFQILPLSFEIAEEVLKIGRALRDPADRTIVATGRVHGLRLLTSDRRIAESNLVQAVD